MSNTNPVDTSFNVVNEIYRFMNDSSAMTSSRMSNETPMSLMGLERKQHSIESFAQRPMQIGNFMLSSTATVGAHLLSFDMMDLLGNANLKGKLEGFRYMRANMEVTAYFNAQPFQAGALLAWYVPYKGGTNVWSQSHDITSRTGCLSETVMFEDGKPLKLRIPFSHPHGFIDLVNSDHCDLGMFYLDVYSPLSSNIASDQLPITVYARFVDVEVYGPTDETSHFVTLEAQSGSATTEMVDLCGCDQLHVRRSVQVVRKVRDAIPVMCFFRFALAWVAGLLFWFSASEPPAVDLEAQMGEAAEQEAAGVVTQVTGTVSQIAGALADVPLISTYAAPISWVAGALNRVAAFFGWSKPVSVHTTGLFKEAPARYMANYNGVDTSNNLGLDADNQIQNYPFFGKEDPLAFDAVISRLNYIGRYTWATSQVNYTKIATLPVDPTMGWVIESNSTNTTPDKFQAKFFRQFTQLNFVSQFFKYWRGNIILQLKCVKTKFHSGRLQISWRPGTKIGTTRPTVPMAYTIVWEVAERSSIAFEIPYLNPKPWLMVQDPEEKSTATDMDFKNGTLEIVVLNRLVASSDVVADNVDIIIEVCGGKGMRFATPVTPTFFPTTKDNIVSTYPVSTVLDGVVSADPVAVVRKKREFWDSESSDDDVDLEGQIGLDSDLIPLVIEGAEDPGLEPEKMSTGERIVSFRQLIKRFSYFPLAGKSYGDEKLNTALDPIRNVNVYSLPAENTYGQRFLPACVCDVDYANVTYGPPQATSQDTGGTPTLPSASKPYVSDLLGLVTSIYAYNRGSVRIKFITPLVASSSSYDHGSFSHALCSLVNGRNKSLSGVQVYSSRSLLNHRAATTLVSEPIEGVGELQFPYYSDVVYMPKSWANFGKYNQDFGRIARIQPKFDLFGVSFNLWRAAGDDYDCAFLMGVPQMQWYDAGG